MRTWYGECCNLFVDWRVRIISSQNVGSIGKFSSATPNKNNLYIASASFIVAPRKYSQIDNSRASPQVFHEFLIQIRLTFVKTTNKETRFFFIGLKIREISESGLGIRKIVW